MSMMPIKYLTIHCAATPEGRDVTADDINSWDIVKFGQKSYHLIILLDGTVVRNLYDTLLGAHVGKNNSHNIGVCYVGGMDAHNEHAKDTRTEHQKVAMRSVVDEYRKKYPGIVVRGHRDWPGVHKDCPSFDVNKEFNT